jgi:hypothetical protein
MAQIDNKPTQIDKQPKIFAINTPSLKHPKEKLVNLTQNDPSQMVMMTGRKKKKRQKSFGSGPLSSLAVPQG